MQRQVTGIGRFFRWGTYSLAAVGIYFMAYTLGCAMLSVWFSEAPNSAAVLFVLGGGRSTEREEVACTRYRVGQSVVLSGNAVDDRFMRRVEHVKQCGVPDDRIGMVLGMTSTATEWQATEEMMLDGKTVAIVSDPPHMGRLFLLRSRDGPDVALVSDVGWYGRYALSRHGLSFVAKEPVKFWWYVFRPLWPS